jgi:uncharacterized protein YjbI with pentapeptide repeats
MTRAVMLEADLRDGHLVRHKNGEFDAVAAEKLHAELSEARMKGATLQRAKLSNAFILPTDLRDSDLRSCVFVRADLSGSDLRDANTTRADFRGARDLLIT